MSGDLNPKCTCGRKKDYPSDRYCLICEDVREDYAQERAREMEDSI